MFATLRYSKFSLLCLIGSVSCSQAGGSAAPSGGVQGAAMSFGDLSAEVFKMSSADRQSHIVAIGKLSVASYYQRLYAAVSDAPLAIGGFETSGLRSAIDKAWPTVAALDTTYPDMSSLWAAGGYSAKFSVSEGEFTATVASMLASKAGMPSLGLADNPLPPLQMPTASQCMQAVSVSPDLSAATSESFLWQSQPDAARPSVVLNPGGSNHIAGFTAAFDQYLNPNANVISRYAVIADDPDQALGAPGQVEYSGASGNQTYKKTEHLDPDGEAMKREYEICTNGVKDKLVITKDRFVRSQNAYGPLDPVSQ